MILATIVQNIEQNVRIYSESISKILWDDVFDADIVFISIFTFNANRGYELAKHIRENSRAKIVFGGLHATLNPSETCKHCDYVLIGEGDESILDLIQYVRSNKPIDFPGVAYWSEDHVVITEKRTPPHNINVIPNRNLLYNYKKMTGYNTIWPQVHASRGCPYNCDYCALVHAFGRQVRFRSPENIIEDIRQAISFHESGHRIAKVLWITDDNFFANREWAKSVLRSIIQANFKYSFTIQARYDVGFDDEMLSLLKEAGFMEIAIGIEFLEDEAFETYSKTCTYSEIQQAIKNIQKHELRVRGLFIVGADNHCKGVGDRLADFVIKHNICGVLIQSMYFIPGTPVFESHKDKLLHEDWSKCTGNVVHYPENISPYDLQKEIMHASRKIYSVKRLISAVFTCRGIDRVLFIGEFFWQQNVRRRLANELPALKEYSSASRKASSEDLRSAEIVT
jgi:radical SAM superfamily enzyme YgiQ (UPF0313 family)